MSRSSGFSGRFFATAAFCLIGAGDLALSAEHHTAQAPSDRTIQEAPVAPESETLFRNQSVNANGTIQPVQAEASTSSAAATGAVPAFTAPAESAAATGAVPSFTPPSTMGSQTRVSATENPTGAIAVAGGQATPRAAPDVGDLLGKAQESTGVELQRRTPVVSDPRVRGYRAGQVATWADGGFFFPARQDLDTAVSKLDSSMLRDVIVTKGPYTVQLGPAFAFLDVATNDALTDTQRFLCGTEYHGRTSYGYQSNGQRMDGSQTFWGGGSDWGFRVSYGIRVGNDYEAGNGYRVPSSYNSQPWNFAVGFDLTKDSSIEIKGLHLDLRDAEFAGLYFDINHLQTDAESIRYTVKDQPYFDRLVLDVWYNRTSADGDTHQGAKQVFLADFWSMSFNTPGLQDHSATTFLEQSRGYRATLSWGTKGSAQVYAGTDLNYVSQHLNEFIRIFNSNGTAVPLFGGIPFGSQDLGIPSSHLADPGLFLETFVPWGKRFSVKAGVRGDWVQTNSAERLVNGSIPLFFNTPTGGFGNVSRSFDPILFSSQPNNNDLHNDYFLWSAFVSADYKIDEHWTALGQFGYAMRPPTLTELYASGPFVAVLQQGLDRLYGDPHLAPEKAMQMEFGVRADYDFLRAGASGFYSWINDYITFDANTQGGTPTTPVAQVVFTNTDLATLAGGEIFLELDLTDWLTPFGNVTYVQGWDRTHIDNRRPIDLASSRRSIVQEALPGIPPLEGRVGLRVHEPTTASHRQPRWSVEGAVRIVNDQDLVATSLGEQKTPGFAVYDLRGYWQVLDGGGHPSPRNPALLVTAGVENIGNKFYREHLDPLAGSPTDLLFRPGINAYFGAQLEY